VCWCWPAACSRRAGGSRVVFGGSELGVSTPAPIRHERALGFCESADYRGRYNYIAKFCLGSASYPEEARSPPRITFNIFLRSGVPRLIRGRF
jgi:hypothetical protein